MAMSTQLYAFPRHRHDSQGFGLGPPEQRSLAMRRPLPGRACRSRAGLLDYTVRDGRPDRLENRMEEEVMEKVFEIYIKTTPERLWKAIVDEEMRSKYSFGLRVRSSWAAGSRYAASHPGAPGFLLEGENLAVDPPHRLVQSFRALWSEDVKREGTSRVTWEIEPVGSSCRLTVTHDQLRQGAHDELYGGWPMILSGLKTLLETGELLETPGSQRYAEPSRYSGSAA
ncbi:MAG: SRPBCC family protein [Solirubrobacterales bacterium]